MTTACRFSRSASLVALVALCALGCERERRPLTEIAPLAAPALGRPHSGLTVGGDAPDGRLPRNTRTTTSALYDRSAWAINEGHHLYTAFNCNGCHGQGGGGEGPPLMDRRWRYGSEPGNLFASIIEGRPNGMPSYRGKLTEMQTWQLVSYVRALGGIVDLDAQPGRADSLSGHPPELILKHRRPRPPRPEGVP